MNVINGNLTLKDLINDAFMKGNKKEDFGKNSDQQQNQAKKIVNWFIKYYGGASKERNDSKNKILSITLNEIRNNQEDFIFQIEEGLKSYPQNKENLAKKVEHLLEYLNRFT